jgi:hypothetical protein
MVHVKNKQMYIDSIPYATLISKDNIETTLFPRRSLRHIQLTIASSSQDILFTITMLYKIQCTDHLSDTKLSVYV